MTEPLQVGARIRRLRRARGLSQAELAGQDLSPSYVSLLEAGKRVPSGEVLRQLASRLGCDVAELSGQDLPMTVPTPDLEVELRYAEMVLRNGDAEAALHAYQAVQQRISVAEHPQLWFAAEMGIAQSLEHCGRLEESIQHYEALREASNGNPESRVSRLTTVVALCRCYRELGDLTHAVELAESTLTELEALDLTPTLLGVELLSTLVGVHFERGDLHRAAYLASRAIEQAEKVSNPKALGAAYWNASLVMHRNGHTADALVLIEKALSIYSEGEDERALARLRNAYASVLLQSDTPDAGAAKGLLEQSADSLSRAGSSVDIAYCHTDLAKAELLLGNAPAAIGHADEALRLLGPNHRLQTARTLLVLAHARLAQDDREGAQAAYERGALILEASEAGRRAAFAWAELAEILQICGDDERAVWAYRQSLRCMGHRETALTASLRQSFSSPN